MLKKRNVLLAASLVFLLGFGLAQPVMAQINIGQAVLNSILGAVGLVFGLIFNVIGTITGFFVGMAVLVFNWVSSPAFISLSYTNVGLAPTDVNYNNFVGTGWELTRSLANIVFVIALVVIGIGTALRMSGYQMQKTLPTLIAIALLVNFTPVIAGLIIDGSNIIMGFFINPNGSSAGQIIAQKATTQWSNISNLVGGGNAPWDPSGGPQAFAAAIASLSYIFFNLIATVIYLLLAGVFVLRYIALWLLVILSPFAFACYILPRTRGVFSQWWKNFIQWSIVGIIAGFFLYLSEHLYQAFSGTGTYTATPDYAAAPGLSPLINALLPSIMPIILLFIGLVAAMTGAPAGAQAILRGGERGLKAAGKTFGKYYGKRAWEGAKKTGEAVSRPVRMGLLNYRTGRRLGETRTGAFGAVLRRTGKDIGGSIKAAPGKMASAVKSAPKKAWVTAKETGKGWSDVVKGKRPAKQGAAQAFSDSLKAGWKAATGSKKKKKGEKCPKCGQPLPFDTDYCPNPTCHQVYT